MVSIQRYAMSGITIGQMISGLDELYKDYKNVNIYIQEAIYVVKKQINGSSSEEIEAILQYLRSGRDYNKLIILIKTEELRSKFSITF
jgi:hypothetical protein